MQWFEALKQDPIALRKALWRMPKGADLHRHLSGSSIERKFEITALTNTLKQTVIAMDEENISYVELQIPFWVEHIERLTQENIKSNVIVKFIPAVVRTFKRANEMLQDAQACVDGDTYVGVSLGGMKELKAPPTMFTKIDAPFSCHAGETMDANTHIADSIAIGANRIGHGLNLYTDPKLMAKMDKLLEVCLISNYKLGHITDYQEHPFPTYLRSGVPVALCTDNPGVQCSTLTDEFFIAVTEYDLTWDEVQTLCRNSIQYAFCDIDTKAILLEQLEHDTQEFIVCIEAKAS